MLLRILVLVSFMAAGSTQADVPTDNVWTILAGDDAGASGVVTDSSLPGFSADFTIVRSSVVSFSGATWTGGPEIDLLNERAGSNPGTGDSIQLEISFSNVVGGSIAGVISEYGTTTNNDIGATWTYTWGSGGTATLLDPDDQMIEVNNSTILTGGLFTSATNELGAALHTWCVTIPTDSVTLNWASPTHAFREAMAFRIQVAAEPVIMSPPTAVPVFSAAELMVLILLLAITGVRFTRSNILAR